VSINPESRGGCIWWPKKIFKETAPLDLNPYLVLEELVEVVKHVLAPT